MWFIVLVLEQISHLWARDTSVSRLTRSAIVTLWDNKTDVSIWHFSCKGPLQQQQSEGNKMTTLVNKRKHKCIRTSSPALPGGPGGPRAPMGPLEKRTFKISTTTRTFKMVASHGCVWSQSNSNNVVIWRNVNILKDNLTVCPGSPGSPACPVCPWGPCWMITGRAN